MFNLFKKKPKSNWTTRYIVERTWEFREGNSSEWQEETITFFLREDQFGNRKVEHESYGECASQGLHRSNKAEMRLWIENGILPDGAKNILIEKLSR